MKRAVSQAQITDRDSPLPSPAQPSPAQPSQVPAQRRSAIVELVISASAMGVELDRVMILEGIEFKVWDVRPRRAEDDSCCGG